MRSFGFLAALLGTAAAAPFMNMGNTIQSNTVKRSANAPRNKFTQVSSGSNKVVVDEKNLINGKYHGDSFSVDGSKSKNTASDPLNLQLVNNIGGDVLNCYITGTDQDKRVFFLGADGQLIYPSSGGSSEPVPIEDTLAIPMPALGDSLDIAVPVAFESGRIYFSQGEIEFFMVQKDGGEEGLVQPNNENEDDPSRNINWGFVELSMTPEGIVWANISYVDFVGLIMSMTLNTKNNGTQEVIGLAADAVPKVCDQLKKQGDIDGRPWGKLCVVGENGEPLRVNSPDLAGFEDYFDEYIEEIWAKYSSEDLTINTQNGDIGDVKCRVEGDEFKCDGDSRPYPKPTAIDVWGCNSGPFTVQEGDNAVHGAVVPRLCAAFNRGTLGIDGGNKQPGPEADKYYTSDPNNHYSRIIHDNEVDGKGYAFAYDDVNPDGSEDAAGLVNGEPNVLIFYAGGKK